MKNKDKKRALISVSNKSGIVELAKYLRSNGWEIISTSGTYKMLKDNGIIVTEVDKLTDFPEIFGGRIKTLHPKIHGGILYRRDNPLDVGEKEKNGIESIDMVVINLYPFKEIYENKLSTNENIIENIDIGGPALIRSASKNYKFVTIITDPSDYKDIMLELEEKRGISIKTRLRMAQKGFSHTAIYDGIIMDYFNRELGEDYPEKLILSYSKKQKLRYGENPHQKAALYESITGEKEGFRNIIKHSGKDLSYNNILDIEESISMIREFTKPTAIGVKHGNPCGVASDENIIDAFKKAYNSDSKSIFGGIVIVNRQVDIELSKHLSEIFIEVIIAPSFSKESIELLKKKNNLRIIESKDIVNNEICKKRFKSVLGGLLLQDDNRPIMNGKMEVVTDKKPDDKMMEDLKFAWKVVKGVKSNGIVIVKDETTIGIGPGQVSRIWALENAIKQGGKEVKGAVLASDGFFPFDDCVEIASDTGIVGIIQPGGSRNDNESIKKSNEENIAMIITGTRHFKH